MVDYKIKRINAEVRKKIAEDFEAGQQDRKALVEKYKDQYIGKLDNRIIATSVNYYCSQEFLKKREEDMAKAVKNLRDEKVVESEIRNRLKLSFADYSKALRIINDQEKHRDYITKEDIEVFKKQISPGDIVGVSVMKYKRDPNGIEYKVLCKQNWKVIEMYPNFAITDHGTKSYGEILNANIRRYHGTA